jgi:hypothetical protein
VQMRTHLRYWYVAVDGGLMNCSLSTEQIMSSFPHDRGDERCACVKNTQNQPVSMLSFADLRGLPEFRGTLFADAVIRGAQT